jgi:predicted PurR-regulated permease PerM
MWAPGHNPAVPKIPTWFVALLVFGAACMFARFVPWMVLAVWLGLFARRVHEPLTRKLGGRRSASAMITVSLLLVIVLPIVVVVTSIVIDAIALVQQLMKSEQAQAVFAKLVQSNGSESIDSSTDVVDLLISQGDRAWSVLSSAAGIAARIVLGLLVMVTGMYGVLVEGRGWYAWIERHGPLSPEHLRRFGDAFIETGRGLWWGIVGAGALQALVATIAFLALGVPSAFALGLLTLMFSILPAIGTAIVWAPVAAGLALTGRPVAAIVLVAIGVGVIGTVDNLARPWLARRGKLELPTWLVLISMFGGISLFGGFGIILGPLLVRLAKEALVISREVRNQATPVQP